MKEDEEFDAKDEREELTNTIIEPCKTGRDAEGPFYKPGSPSVSITFRIGASGL